MNEYLILHNYCLKLFTKIYNIYLTTKTLYYSLNNIILHWKKIWCLRIEISLSQHIKLTTAHAYCAYTYGQCAKFEMIFLICYKNLFWLSILLTRLGNNLKYNWDCSLVIRFFSRIWIHGLKTEKSLYAHSFVSCCESTRVVS